MRVFHFKSSLIALSTAALLSACVTSPKMMKEDGTEYDVAAQYEKFAKVDMNPDTSFLSASEKAVVNKLIQASEYLSEIYLRQRGADYPALREEIAQNGSKTQLAMFDLHYGPCDSLESDFAFYGDTQCAEGGGFYPTDMTRQEFEDWIAAHPSDEAAFTSGYKIGRAHV